MPNIELASLHLLIKGRVQGVGFRHYVHQCIGVLSIHGWVRNLDDGRVEILAEGSRKDLESFLIEVEKGPSLSQITNIIRTWEKGSGKYKGFQILATVFKPG